MQARTLLMAVISVAFTACPFFSARAEFRLATVDLNRVMNESKDAVEKKKTLDDLSLKAKKKVEAKKQSLLDLEKKIKQSDLAPDSKEVDSFQTEVKNFSRFAKDSEDELKKEFLRINRGLTDRAVEVVRKYAKNNKIDLVVDKSDKLKGPVLFGDPGVDITDSVIKDMNAQ